MKQKAEPEILYRYRSLSSSFANTLIEITGWLWLSRAEGLNDPFDGLRYAKKIQGTLLEEKKINIPLDYIWSIACFTTKWNNPTMWAHYANNYKGICLGYDKIELDEHVEIENKPTVSYTTQGAFLEPMKYVSNIPENFNTPIEPLTIKTKNWEYEDEWRLGLLEVYGNANISDNGTQHFLKKGLKEIIFSEHINTNELRILKKIAEMTNPSIKFYKINFADGKRKIIRNEYK